MVPVVKKVGDTDESYSWADAVKDPSGHSPYRNGPQYVDPRNVVVPVTQKEETQKEDTEEMVEICDMCVCVCNFLRSEPVVCVCV